MTAAANFADDYEPELAPVPPALLRIPEVCRLVAIGETMLRELMAAGQFPAPVQIPGIRAVRWRRADVEAWIAALPART